MKDNREHQDLKAETARLIQHLQKTNNVKPNTFQELISLPEKQLMELRYDLAKTTSPTNKLIDIAAINHIKSKN
jgi:hypothetical protein